MGILAVLILICLICVLILLPQWKCDRFRLDSNISLRGTPSSLKAITKAARVGRKIGTKLLTNPRKTPQLCQHVSRRDPRSVRARKVPLDFSTEESCKKMNGKIAMGLMILESSKSGGPVFSDDEKVQLIIDCLNMQTFFNEQKPTGDITWVTDLQFSSINVSNKPVRIDTLDRALDEYWFEPAITTLTYNGKKFTSIVDYTEELRVKTKSDHAFLLIVTPFTTSWFGYTTPEDNYLCISSYDNYGGWGTDKVSEIMAHETCHIFGADDEYGKACDYCWTESGCNDVENANCDECNTSAVGCIMRPNSGVLKLCPSTMGQIGWIDSYVTVEITTDTATFSGTDTDVNIRFGKLAYSLNNPFSDDFEAGSISSFKIWDGNLKKEMLKTFIISLDPGSVTDNWKIKRIRIKYIDEVVLDIYPKVWLMTGQLSWSNSVKPVTVKITTGSQFGSGTDSDVLISFSGKTYTLDTPGTNDFESGNTDVFQIWDPFLTEADLLKTFSIRLSPADNDWRLERVQILRSGKVLRDVWPKKILNGLNPIWTWTAGVAPMRKVTVTITTGTDWFSGTDNDVFITFGNGVSHQLDTSGHDDFENGSTFPYTFNDNATDSQLQKFSLTLVPGAITDDLKVNRVVISADGVQKVDVSPHVWLHPGALTWYT